MNKISKLRIAIDFISEFDEFNDISFIATLNWSSIPEAYNHERTLVVSGHRVAIYSLNSTKVLNISGVGFYQIM